MTTYTFIPKASTTNVQWSDPTIWSGGVVPNAPDADVIFPTVTTSGGSIYSSNVSIPSGQVFSIRSASLTNNGLSLNFSGLNAVGDFAVNAGGRVGLAASATLNVGSLENNGFIGADLGHINVSAALSNTGQLSGGHLTVTAASFTNTGVVMASGGDVTLTVNSGGFTNLSGSTLTGGTYQAGFDNNGHIATIFLNVGGLIANDAAQIVLSGGDVASFDTASQTYIPVESTLHSIATSGVLTLQGRTFNWGSLTVDGTLTVSPLIPSDSSPTLSTTLNAPQLVITANGHVNGTGTIHAPIANDGLVISNALKIDGSVSGSGKLEIATGGTLELTGAVSQTVMFLGNSGLLTLDNPSSFTGAIAPAGPGDRINLAGVSLNSVTGYHYSGNDSGGVLTIHTSGGDIQLNFAGHFSTQSFRLSAGDQPLSTSPPSLVITEDGFIAPPTDDNAIPQDINNNGDIVGYYVDQNGTHHGFLKSGGSYVEVPIIGFPATSEFHGINDAGDITGTVNGTTTNPNLFGSQVVSGFIYHNGSFTFYDRAQSPTGGDQTNFEDINSAGNVVGYFHNPNLFNPRDTEPKFNGFLFHNGTYQAIGPANDTLPYGSNDKGQIVGSYVETFFTTIGFGSGQHKPSVGFLYDPNAATQFSTFTVPTASQTFARDINDADIVVGYYESGSGTHGFAYNATTGAWAPIDAPGAVTTHVYGINDLNQVVGDYTDHGGATHSFVGTVPPPFPTAPGNVDEWILSNGQWEASAQPGPHPAGYRVAAVADFTGNHTSDILWQNVNTGGVDLWKISTGAWAGSVDLGPHPGAGWQIAGAGDFNRDGTNDVFWFNPGTGETDIWQLANGQWQASVQPGAHPPGYQVAGIGDFNHDGTSDVLWFNPTTRDVDEWNISNGHWAGSNSIGVYPDAGSQIAGVGDFNKDGTSDVLWYNPSTGATDIWMLQNGHWSASVSPGTHATGWQVAGVGDFNGDGTSDVLWFNPATHDAEEWIIANGHSTATIDIGVHPGSATIAGVGDFNGGGTSDVLWHQFV